MSIFAWEAIQAWRTGNHRAGLLHIFIDYSFWINFYRIQEEKERWNQEHGPHLGGEKVKKVCSVNQHIVTKHALCPITWAQMMWKWMIIHGIQTGYLEKQIGNLTHCVISILIKVEKVAYDGGYWEGSQILRPPVLLLGKWIYASCGSESRKVYTLTPQLLPVDLGSRMNGDPVVCRSSLPLCSTFAFDQFVIQILFL